MSKVKGVGLRAKSKARLYMHGNLALYIKLWQNELEYNLAVNVCNNIDKLRPKPFTLSPLTTERSNT